MQTLPKARRSELVIQEVGNELLVYDLRTNRAISLNPTAAAIWNNCGSDSTIDEISRHTGVKKELVELALSDLRKNGLLESGGLPEVGRLTRRKVLAGATVAFAAIPVILAITAPAAAQAGSCVGNGLPVSVSNSSAAGGCAQCGDTLASKCCTQTVSNIHCTTNTDNTVNCTGTCGFIPSAEGPLMLPGR